MAMLTGHIDRFIDGRKRANKRSFAFIRPDKDLTDVFAPVSNLEGARGAYDRPRLLDYLANAAINKKKVAYVTEGIKTDNPMATRWKMVNEDPPPLSCSPSRSPRRSLSRSDSRPRSRSRGRSRSRSRSPSRRSNSPIRSCKVTVCDIPSDMSAAELENLGKMAGDPVLSAHTYKKSDRFFGVLEFSDRQAVEKCISKLDGKRVHGSDFRLRCVEGMIHEEQNREGNHERPRSREGDHERPRSHAGDRCQQEKHGRSRSPARKWNTQNNKANAGGDIRPGDWTCVSCGANVFASKDVCFKCGTPKPPRGKGRGGGGGRENDGQIMTLFLRDLPMNIEENEIRDEFERMSCGTKSILRVMLQPKPNVTNAFIRFSAVKFAKRALEDVEDGDIKFRGRGFRCDWSKTNTAAN